MTAPDAGRMPAAPAQQDLWVFEQIAFPSLAYLVVRAVDIDGPVDLVALRRALDRLAERHPVLLRGAVVDDHDQMWLADGARRVELGLLAAPAGPPTGRPGRSGPELGSAALEAAAAEVSLEEPPAWRALLAGDPGVRATLVLVFHHALVDGPAAELAITELARLYAAEAGDETAVPPSVPDSYHAFARRQRAAAAEPDTDDLAYWRSRLATGGTRAPWSVAATTSRTRHRRTSRAVPLPPRLGARLAAAAPGAGVTPFALCLAAVAATVAGRLGSAEVTLALGISRQDPADAGTIGMYVDPVLLRIPVAGCTLDLLQTAFDTLVDALDHASVPHQRVLRELAGRAPGEVGALADASVTRHTLRIAEHRVPGAVWRPVAPASAYSPYPLHFGFQDDGADELWLVLGADPDLVDAATVDATEAAVVATVDEVARLAESAG